MKNKYISPEFEIIELGSMKLMSTSELQREEDQEEVNAESKAFRSDLLVEDDSPWQ